MIKAGIIGATGYAGQAIQNLNIMNGFPQNMAINYVPTCI